MALTLMVAVIVITPVVMVVCIICKTKELHTKYYFFVANVLATNLINISIENILLYVIMILYLIGFESHYTENTIKQFILPLHMILKFTSTLLLIPLAFALIALSFRYKHYVTNKTMATMIAAVWVLSAALRVIITIVVPVQIVRPLAVINFSNEIILIIICLLG